MWTKECKPTNDFSAADTIVMLCPCSFSLNKHFSVNRFPGSLNVSLSPPTRWRRAAKLGGAADVSRPQPPDLAQRHHPHAQVLPHLLRQRERRQAPVPAVLSEADPAHGVPAAQDLPSSHQDRLDKPQPAALLAARHSAGGTQLPDWWWGHRAEMHRNITLYEFGISQVNITATTVCSLFYTQRGKWEKENLVWSKFFFLLLLKNKWKRIIFLSSLFIHSFIYFLFV